MVGIHGRMFSSYICTYRSMEKVLLVLNHKEIVCHFNIGVFHFDVVAKSCKSYEAKTPNIYFLNLTVLRLKYRNANSKNFVLCIKFFLSSLPTSPAVDESFSNNC